MLEYLIIGRNYCLPLSSPCLLLCFLNTISSSRILAIAAAKTAMNLFSHMPEATTREKELMKACTDPELVAAIVGNVKISAAGLNQLKQKQKKAKKSGKQER